MRTPPSLFFLLEEGKRLALRRVQGEYQHQGRHFSTADLQARASQISQNALLRPVVQDYMLPTVAYIGGPAELAYFAQSQVIYSRLLGRQPVPRPRAGFTLLDHHSAKLMTRYDLHVPDFFAGEGALRGKGRGQADSPRAHRAHGGDARHYRALARPAQNSTHRFRFHPGQGAQPQPPQDGVPARKDRRKIARQTMLRDQRASHDATALTNLIYPHKHLQERLYSILPFLAKHGPSLIDAIYEHVHPDCPDHKFLTL